MSAPEHVQEAKSSIKISCNAKGEAQPEVKIVEGADAAEIERIRVLAVNTYNATARAVRYETPQTGGSAS